MIRIDEGLLEELDLDELPLAQKNSLLRAIYEELELRASAVLSGLMSLTQLDEFESLVETEDENEDQILAWLIENFPNYDQLVRDEFEALRAEVVASTNEIRLVSLAFESGPEEPGRTGSEVAPKGRHEELIRAEYSERPGDPSLVLELGLVVMQRDPSMAIDLFEKLASITPDDAKAHAYLADAYAHNHRADDAELSLRRALDLEPGNPSITYRLARLILALHRPQESLILLDHVADPDSDSRLQELRLEALQQVQDYETAFELIVSANSVGDNANDFGLLGEHCYSQDMAELGVLAFAEAQRLDPIDSRWRVGLILCLEMAGDIREALELFSEPAEWTHQAGSLEIRARLHLRLGEFEAAADSLNEMEENHPDFPIGPSLASAIWSQCGEYERSHTITKEWLEQEPESVAALRAHASSLLDLDRAGEARDLARRGLSIDPKHLGCLTIAGIASLRLAEDLAAMESFELCLAVERSATSLYNLAVALIGRASVVGSFDGEEALRLLEKAEASLHEADSLRDQPRDSCEENLLIALLAARSHPDISLEQLDIVRSIGSFRRLTDLIGGILGGEERLIDDLAHYTPIRAGEIAFLRAVVLAGRNSGLSSDSFWKALAEKLITVYGSV